MNDLAQRGPMGLKPERKRKPGLRPVSAKRAAQHRSSEGLDDMLYMSTVKSLPCVACGAVPCDAHHCKDTPPAWGYDPYEQRPAANRKSGARDTIPLCKSCHTDGPDAYHKSRVAWRAKNGADYHHIMPTRARVDAKLGEIDF